MILEGLSGSSGLVDGTQSAGSQAKLNEELNSFLNLLITQLKNQDPLDPMDATEFTSQLVQFASVEQQIYQNAHLENLLNLEKTSQVATMVDYLGTTVEASGHMLNLEGDGAKFTYTQGNGVDGSTMVIRNEAGLAVFTADADSEPGQHTFEWDGKANGGEQQPDGIYTVTVTATDRAGEILDVGQTIFGRVTGAGVDNSGVVLYMGELSVPMGDVLSVNETKAKTE